MERIRLNVERTFSDLFTTTLHFVRQEAKPLVKAFAVIVLPVIVLMVIGVSRFLVETFDMAFGMASNTEEEAWGWVVNYGASVIIAMFLGFWLQLFTLSYLRVYGERGAGEGASGIGTGEVFAMMRRKFWPMVGWGLLYGIIVMAGLMFCIVPGVWLGVALGFGGYFVVMRDEGVAEAFSRSWELVKGHWWMSFGYVVVWALLLSVAGWVFGIPNLVVMVVAGATGMAPNMWLVVAASLVSYAGQYAMYPAMGAGVGLLFTSLLESREHTGLQERIAAMGTEGNGDEGLGAFPGGNQGA